MFDPNTRSSVKVVPRGLANEDILEKLDGVPSNLHIKTYLLSASIFQNKISLRSPDIIPIKSQ